jgi:hypothetical protein
MKLFIPPFKLCMEIVIRTVQIWCMYTSTKTWSVYLSRVHVQFGYHSAIQLLKANMYVCNYTVAHAFCKLPIQLDDSVPKAH